VLEEDVTASDYFEEPVTMFSSHALEYKPSIAQMDWSVLKDDYNEKLLKNNEEEPLLEEEDTVACSLNDLSRLSHICDESKDIRKKKSSRVLFIVKKMKDARKKRVNRESNEFKR
jgi:hypothetical protein